MKQKNEELIAENETLIKERDELKEKVLAQQGMLDQFKTLRDMMSSLY